MVDGVSGVQNCRSMHPLTHLLLALMITLGAGCGSTPRAGPASSTPPPEASPEADDQERATAEVLITVRDIDWASRTYAVGGETCEVHDGEAEWNRGDGDQGYLWVTEPTFGDLTGDGTEEAIIMTLLNTGGIGRFSSVLIFHMVDGSPVLLEELPGGDRGDGGLDNAGLCPSLSTLSAIM